MISSPRQEGSRGERADSDPLNNFRGTANNKKPYTFASHPQPLSIRTQLDRDNGVRRGGHVHDEFVRKLDAKLKKLQQHHRQQAAAGAAVRRPIFITTVKTGVFLDPPPDLAALLGLDDGGPSANGSASKRSYYSYSSKPRVLYDKQHQRCAPCKNEPDDMCKQLGYTNIMHDKRVIRGSNFSKKPYRPKWNPYFGYAKQLSTELNKEYSATREDEARRRAMARKKAMDYQTRALRLHLGGPKSRGRQNVDSQTSSHLEELYENPSSQTFGAQTDEFECEPPPSNRRTGASTTTDASTQVDDNDLFDFDTMVTPVAEALVQNTFKKAIEEILYEDELDALARHRRTSQSKHIAQQRENQSLPQITADHTRCFDEGATKDDVSAREEVLLTSESVSDLLPDVPGDLIRDGFVDDAGAASKTVESPEFLPSLMEQSQADHKERIENVDFLIDMIGDEVQNRLTVLEDTGVIAEVQNDLRPENDQDVKNTGQEEVDSSTQNDNLKQEANVETPNCVLFGESLKLD